VQEKSKPSVVAIAGFLVALMAGLAALLAGPCTSFGLWNFRTGITVLKWAAYGGAAGAVLSLIGLMASLRIVILRGFFWALIGVVIGSLLMGIMLHWKEAAEVLPRIHDVTTDTKNPPEFVQILRLRKSDENSPVYEGGEVAARQRKAYPEIVPLNLPLPPDQAFEKALATARNLGWQIIDADENAGRIEAVATTLIFGFKDDIVIRVRPRDSGSLIDIRSESRVGVSDLGKNAERIGKFLKAMRK